jgi:DNA invertase Pin-like site-specific DNA recombinase
MADTRPIAIYARTSTTDQHADAQLPRLRAYASARGTEALEFVDEGVSGARRSRPALDRLMTAARRREIAAIVCVKLDRIARSVGHLAALSEELQALGIDLVVLDQALDTATPSGRLLFHMLGAIAEFERDLIRERTRDGLAAARRRGARIGRPRRLDASARRRLLRLRRSGKSLRECASLLDCGVATASRELRRSA